GGVEDAHGLGGGEGEPAEVAPRGHRADEHAVVEGVVLHADAVAEDGTARERRRRVDGQDRDPLAARPELAEQRGGQGGLAGAWRAGDADGVGGTAAGVGEGAGGTGVLTAPLDHGEQARHRPAVAARRGVHELLGIPSGSGHGPSSYRLTELSMKVSPMLRTSVTPSTRFFRMRSTP